MRRLALLLIPLALFADTPAIKSLYSSLDPYSLTQQMAFYELYPETEEGRKALSHAWELLSQGSSLSKLPRLLLPLCDIQPIISLVTRQPFDAPIQLGDDQLATIQKLSSHFANRKLRGAHVWTKEEVLALPPKEIDLARGLLIEQFDDAEEFRKAVLQYEASLDLMALQIAARLPQRPSHIDKIRAINRYIFQEMQFRFPPHSLWAKDVDVYTFLPSVLDSRQGVCLGVSILYLCLAQRLDLPLEIITPPGHIYIRYHQGKTLINIETTARGINPPSETYLGINTRKLEKRTIKEVIGMAFVNQASVFWQKQEYATCVDLYEKALPYLKDYPLIKLFLGLNYLFVGRIEEGEKLLRLLKEITFDYAVAPETLPADYLEGKVDAAGLKAVFLPVDETRASILAKQQELTTLLEKHPQFRGGILQLAITYLQLGRAGEARNILTRYHTLDPHDPTVEYYLSIVCAERYDFKSAWTYLKNAEAITAARNHNPIALRSLRNKLRTVCPEH